MIPIKIVLWFVVFHLAGFAATLLLQIIFHLRKNNDMESSKLMEIIRLSEIWEAFVINKLILNKGTK